MPKQPGTPVRQRRLKKKKGSEEKSIVIVAEPSILLVLLLALRQLVLLRTYSRYSLLAVPLVSELTRHRRSWITLLRQRGSDLTCPETRERGFPLLGPVSWIKDATAYLIKS